MASPTRDEFLGYIHQPCRNRDGDPLPGSPTKSTRRYRWRELRDWDIERDATEYWAGLPDADKTQTVNVRPGYWDFIADQLESSDEPLTSEHVLQFPFSNALRNPLNKAIRGASDAHAEMWTEGSKLAKEPVGNPDFIMVYEGKLTGLVELKTWWNVTDAEIDDVRTGPSPSPFPSPVLAHSNIQAANPLRESTTAASQSNKPTATSSSTKSSTAS